jgi:hypothetical protein
VRKMAAFAAALSKKLNAKDVTDTSR